MLKTLLKDLADPLWFAISKGRLRRLETTLKTHATRLAIPFLYKGEGHYRRIAPIQSQEEIAALYREVCALAPKVVVEIGTCHGGSLYLWCQAADPASTVISLDLPNGKFGGGYHEARAKLYGCFATASQHLHLIRDDSHSPACVGNILGLLDNRKIDFLFIDGDHSYQGVKRDYETYAPLVRDGGIIAFHDILPSPPSLGMEVWRFWQELKTRIPNVREFVNTQSGDRKIGIGVVVK